MFVNPLYRANCAVASGRSARPCMAVTASAQLLVLGLAARIAAATCAQSGSPSRFTLALWHRLPNPKMAANCHTDTLTKLLLHPDRAPRCGGVTRPRRGNRPRHRDVRDGAGPGVRPSSGLFSDGGPLPRRPETSGGESQTDESGGTPVG